MVGSSQAERLHKACDVLLRAASKIQDLPPGIQQEEVVVEEEGESITLYTNADPLADVPNEQITIRHNPVPLYEINFSSVNAIADPNRSTKKVKSRDKLQVCDPCPMVWVCWVFDLESVKVRNRSRRKGSCEWLYVRVIKMLVRISANRSWIFVAET